MNLFSNKNEIKKISEALGLTEEEVKSYLFIDGGSHSFSLSGILTPREAKEKFHSLTKDEDKILVRKRWKVLVYEGIELASTDEDYEELFENVPKGSTEEVDVVISWAGNCKDEASIVNLYTKCGSSNKGMSTILAKWLSLSNSEESLMRMCDRLVEDGLHDAANVVKKKLGGYLSESIFKVKTPEEIQSYLKYVWPDSSQELLLYKQWIKLCENRAEVLLLISFVKGSPAILRLAVEKLTGLCKTLEELSEVEYNKTTKDLYFLREEELIHEFIKGKPTFEECKENSEVIKPKTPQSQVFYMYWATTCKSISDAAVMYDLLSGYYVGEIIAVKRWSELCMTLPVLGALRSRMNGQYDEILLKRESELVDEFLSEEKDFDDFMKCIQEISKTTASSRKFVLKFMDACVNFRMMETLHDSEIHDEATYIDIVKKWVGLAVNFHQLYEIKSRVSLEFGLIIRDRVPEIVDLFIKRNPQFESFIKNSEYLSAETPGAEVFYAEWCKICKTLDDYFVVYQHVEKDSRLEYMVLQDAIQSFESISDLNSFRAAINDDRYEELFAKKQAELLVERVKTISTWKEYDLLSSELRNYGQDLRWFFSNWLDLTKDKEKFTKVFETTKEGSIEAYLVASRWVDLCDNLNSLAYVRNVISDRYDPLIDQRKLELLPILINKIKTPSMAQNLLPHVPAKSYEYELILHKWMEVISTPKEYNKLYGACPNGVSLIPILVKNWFDSCSSADEKETFAIEVSRGVSMIPVDSLIEMYKEFGALARLRSIVPKSYIGRIDEDLRGELVLELDKIDDLQKLPGLVEFTEPGSDERKKLSIKAAELMYPGIWPRYKK